MQVSVPGMSKKPAPYSEQIRTYSIALALTGRSAACAPLTASSAAAEPRMKLLIVVIRNALRTVARRGVNLTLREAEGTNSLRDQHSQSYHLIIVWGVT